MAEKIVLKNDTLSSVRVATTPIKQSSSGDGTPKKKNKKMTCLTCGKTSGTYVRDFLSTNNPMYGYLRLLPICKNCARVMYSNLVVEYQDEQTALRVFCLRLNIYYNQAVADSLTKHGANLIGEYIKKISSYESRTYEDTLIEEGYSFERTVEEPEEEEECDSNHYNIFKKTVAMFGDSFSDEDLFYLQTQYTDWTRRYECNEKSLEIMIKNICLMDLDIRKTAQEGGDVSKKMTALSKAIIDANLKPVLDGSSDIGEYSLGQYIEKWEDEKPIPVIDDPDFKDKDGILNYVQTWFFGHLTKVFGKRNSYSEMYEREINKYTVEKPTYTDDEDLNESVFGEND